MVLKDLRTEMCGGRYEQSQAHLKEGILKRSRTIAAQECDATNALSNFYSRLNKKIRDEQKCFAVAYYFFAMKVNIIFLPASHH